MLAHNGIIFAEGKLFRLGAGILLGDIEETRVRCAGELDLDGCWLGHLPDTLNWNETRDSPRGSRGLIDISPGMSSDAAESQPGLSALPLLPPGVYGSTCDSGSKNFCPGWNSVVPAKPNMPRDGEGFSCAASAWSGDVFESATQIS